MPASDRRPLAHPRPSTCSCVLATLGLGAYMALNNSVSLGTCYAFFIYSFSFAFALSNLTNTVRGGGGGEHTGRGRCSSGRAGVGASHRRQGAALLLVQHCRQGALPMGGGGRCLLPTAPPVVPWCRCRWETWRAPAAPSAAP